MLVPESQDHFTPGYYFEGEEYFFNFRVAAVGKMLHGMNNSVYQGGIGEMEKMGKSSGEAQPERRRSAGRMLTSIRPGAGGGNGRL